MTALVWAGRAGAALLLLFSPPSGAPGTAVEARTGGEGALAQSVPVTIPVYLVPDAEAPGVPVAVDAAAVLARNPSVTPVGNLRSDPRGNGWLGFTVPDLPPGRYQAFAFCPPCARYSVGRNVLPVGEFTITDPEGRYRGRGPWVSVLLAACLLAAMVGVAVLVERRRAGPG